MNSCQIPVQKRYARRRTTSRLKKNEIPFNVYWLIGGVLTGGLLIQDSRQISLRKSQEVIGITSYSYDEKMYIEDGGGREREENRG